MGEKEKALDHYLRAWRVNESLGLTRRIIQDANQIASLYDDLGQPEEAERFRRRAEELTASPQ
jgi:tetratricopeptide (TPR) repeat protein